VALRAHGAASAPAARAIALAMNRLSTILASTRGGLIRHGALRAIVAAVNAHFDVPAVVNYMTAALAAIALGASSPSPGMARGGAVVFYEPIEDMPFPPGSGVEEGEESESHAEAAGGAAADDDVAALARA
jgi:hypothetical protein